MRTKRRTFFRTALGGTVTLCGGAAAATAAEAKPSPAEATFKLHPVGEVKVTGDTAAIHIFDPYADALRGLEDWSHVNVLWWFDKNDVPQKRKILQVHPRGNQANPLTGVFACRSPVRPNLIGLTVCRILKVEKGVITVDAIDAFDGTPVIDLKPFIPPDAPREGVRVPAWAGTGR
jgi:tRNA-Thr(GGU) m(6)t(6)A37 methyltransferase TsaA